MAALWKTLRMQGNGDASSVLRKVAVYKPPVDVFSVARGLGAQVYAVEGPGWEGALEIRDQVPHIWVDVAHHIVRQRFTIAHEIGHLMLHDEGVRYRDVTFYGGPLEREANLYAANLLMPLWLLTPAVQEWGRDIDRLSGLFEVSRKAMEIQLRYV
jgi:hypothetical protein